MFMAFAGAVTLAAFSASAAETPLWLRDVKISPKGDVIAFTYKGDIWTVPVAGGEARRLTTLPSYETAPVWSPDGNEIAFASDRHGNFDIFVMDARGGAARRLTSNSASEIPEGFSPDGKEVYFSAAIQAPTASAMFPSGRMTQLYTVPVAGGASRQVLGTPATNLAFSPDGEVMLYTDVKGFEDEWRKHHTSSVTRDVWRYDRKTGRHTNLTNRAGEDRNPVLDPATGAVYILSERDGGTFNVYTFPLDAPDKAERITDFTVHPVRFLSRAANGTMAFTWDGEIYTMTDGAKPQKVAITVTSDDEAATRRLSASPTSDAAVSPDGTQAAFVSRGDIFVTSVEYPTTKQITSTPQAEYDVTWAPDSRTIYYTSDRDGRKAIYKAEIGRKEDANFPNAAIVKETLVLGDADNDYSNPRISPDGKKMAYTRNRNKLTVRDLATGKETPASTDVYPGYDDGLNYVWSPDSRWLALEFIPEMHDPYSDIALMNAATGEVTDITRNGYFDASPRFTPEGDAIVYITDTYGMRNHASWGSQTDVMIAFLNREARDRFMMSKEDAALAEEARKEASKKAEADKKDGKKGKKSDKSKKEDADKDKPVTVELDGIDTRIMRLTPWSSDYSDAIVSADGETLYYLADTGDGPDLWTLPLREGDPSLAAHIGSGGISLQATKDGKTLFVMGPKMSKIDKGDKLKAIKADAKHDIDPAAEREAMFDYMAAEEGARFYDTGMHGVDWPMMTAAYRRFLPHINNNYDFAEMLSEILGELNVSHTGGRYRGAAASNADRTASLGLLYDMAYDGRGLKVDEIITDGPFDKAASRMVPGSIVTAVNSVEITPDTDMGALFNNIAGKKTLVAFTTPAGEEITEVVSPVGQGAISDLLYQRWVRRRAAQVDSLSNGRLGYVHIESMSDDSFRPMYSALFGKYNNREGVVVDIRWNGGGRMHEDIEALLTGQKYLTQVIRGKDVCDMPSRRWNKPSVMLVAEPCYSNAHGTPWVYQHQKIGKVVGMPVPGTMTSVNWVTMQDPSLIFGIPVIGYRTAEGNYLENTQLEPDVKVANSPESIVTGEDTQLRVAVETLLRQIDGK